MPIKATILDDPPRMRQEIIALINRYWPFLMNKRVDESAFDSAYKGIPASSHFVEFHKEFWNAMDDFDLAPPDSAPGFQRYYKKTLLRNFDARLQQDEAASKSLYFDFLTFVLEKEQAEELEKNKNIQKIMKILPVFSLYRDAVLSPFESPGLLKKMKAEDKVLKVMIDFLNAHLMLFLQTEAQKSEYHFALTGVSTYYAYRKPCAGFSEAEWGRFGRYLYRNIELMDMLYENLAVIQSIGELFNCHQMKEQSLAARSIGLYAQDQLDQPDCDVEQELNDLPDSPSPSGKGAALTPDSVADRVSPSDLPASSVEDADQESRSIPVMHDLKSPLSQVLSPTPLASV